MRFLHMMYLLLVFAACSGGDNKIPRVVIQTSLGDIEVELYAEKAPKSVAAFLSYVDSGFYKNSSFYRVLNGYNQPSYAPKSELIQGGFWKSNPRKARQIPGIPHETTRETGILHKNGTISLARAEPGTAGSEFFICLGDQPGFDHGGVNNPDGQGFAAFGKVVRGLNIAWKIYERRAEDQDFDPPIPIYNITRK